MGLKTEHYDLDELDKLAAGIDYEWQRDEDGNQILVMDFENGQHFTRLLKALPWLIGQALAKEAMDSNWAPD